MTEQQTAFWEAIDVFDKEGLLPYVMLIGSWAEYIYQFHLKSEFKANLKTRDVDFLYPNLNRPKASDIKIIKGLSEKGFVYKEDYMSGVGKFIKEDLLELEFITRALGKGQSINEIPSLNIKAEGLRVVNMLADYPLELDCNNFIITVPEPEAYIPANTAAQKWSKGASLLSPQETCRWRSLSFIQKQSLKRRVLLLR